jgi:hypothetical protein
MWKALQKIARVFGLKATKGKATIDGKRNSTFETDYSDATFFAPENAL